MDTHKSSLAEQFCVLTSVHMSTGKTIDVTQNASIVQVMSSLFNMLSKFVRTFLPGGNCLLVL